VNYLLLPERENHDFREIVDESRDIHGNPCFATTYGEN
jgi:hypothetical protein